VNDWPTNRSVRKWRGSQQLGRPALSQWCGERLGSEPETILFTGHLSEVTGLRLADGRQVVVKVRRWEDRLVACGQVQHRLQQQGFPAPHLRAGPDRYGSLGVSAEALITGGDLLAPQHDSAVRFAEALARVIQLAPDPEGVCTLSPSPAWVGWDHAADELWPAPDDREGDLNVVPGHRWVDEIGAAAGRQLRALDRPAVISHGDWYSQNLRWVDRRLHAVHDWDSVVAQPKAAIVGQAAAVWPGTGLPGEVATVQQSEEFLLRYMQAFARSWTDDEIEAARAAGLWTRAFDAWDDATDAYAEAVGKVRDRRGEADEAGLGDRILGRAVGSRVPASRGGDVDHGAAVMHKRQC
jgi:hypothetical protein